MTVNKTKAAHHSHAAKHTSRAGLNLQNLVRVAESPKVKGARGGAVQHHANFFEGASGHIKSR